MFDHAGECRDDLISMRKQEMRKLKLCPFCGGYAKAEKNDLTLGKEKIYQRWVQCGICASSTGFYGSTKEVARAWNRRMK